MTDLCKTFRGQASQVWHRMSKAHALDMQLTEETITEMALFEIALAQQSSPDFVVSMHSKRVEARTGADWEWWLVKNGRGIGFRVQAKRLYRTGKYDRLFRGSDRFAQANKLISGAVDSHCVPLYCFYNYPNSAGFSRFPINGCRHHYRGESRWGCALVDAYQVVDLNKNKLEHLSPVSTPWHELVCCRRNESLPDAGLRVVKEMRNGMAPTKVEPPAATLRDLPFHVVVLLARRRGLSEADWKATSIGGVPLDEVEGGLDFLPEGVAGVAIFEDCRD